MRNSAASDNMSAPSNPGMTGLFSFLRWVTPEDAPPGLFASMCC